MTAEQWVETKIHDLLQEFASAEAMRPVLLSLVPRRDGVANQCRLPLEHTEGVEILDDGAHPWPHAIASIFARGYRGDFLVVIQLNGRTDFRVLGYRGGGIHQLAGRPVGLDDFRGPLDSEEPGPLSTDMKKRATEAARVFKREREAGACMYVMPGGEACLKPPIRSHSVGRSEHLQRIAENGHVLGYSRDTLRHLLHVGTTMESIGIKNASTFPGFCAAHDHDLFKEIDRSPIELNLRTAALLAYRIVCLDAHAKRSSLRAMREITGLAIPDAPFEDAVLPPRIRNTVLGYRDALLEKKDWECVLHDAQRHGKVRFHAIRFSPTPEILGVARICVDIDFLGRPLQDIESPERLDYLSVSVLQDADAGVVVFAWLHTPAQIGERMIASLLRVKSEHRMDHVIRTVFAHSENLYWSPAWWRGLPLGTQEELETLMQVGVVPWLQPLDQSKLVDWTPTEVLGNWQSSAK